MTYFLMRKSSALEKVGAGEMLAKLNEVLMRLLLRRGSAFQVVSASLLPLLERL